MKSYVISACSPADLNKNILKNEIFHIYVLNMNWLIQPIQMTYLNLYPLVTSIKQW